MAYSTSPIFLKEEKPLAVFTNRPQQRKRAILRLIGFALLVLIALLIYLGIRKVIPGVPAHGPGYMWIYIMRAVPLLLLFLAAVLWLIIANLPVPQKSVEILPDMLKVRIGAKRSSLPWKEIERIRLDFYRPSLLGFTGKRRNRLWIGLKDRSLLIDESYENSNELIRLIRSITSPILLEQASRQVSLQGKTIYGPIVVRSDQKIQFENKTLDLETLQELSLRNGRLSLRFHEIPTIHISTRKIDNLDSLLLHMSKIVKSNRAKNTSGFEA